MLSLNGALLIDKPAHISSFGVIEQLQSALARRYEIKKKRDLPSIGHGGTLDPFATGLLIVFVGDGVKLSRYFLGSDKTYEASIVFGEQTESADLTTPVTHRTSHLPKKIEEIQSAANTFIGCNYAQTPPMYSAKKKDGVRLYEMAREGITIEREAKLLSIHSFQVTEFESPQAKFRVSCSSGTYIRTLAEDLAHKLDSLAHLNGLRRLESTPFHIKDAAPLDRLLEQIEKGLNVSESSSFVKIDNLMNHFEQFQINSDEARKIRQGNRETVKELNSRFDSKLPNQSLIVLKNEGALVAIMRKNELFFELERVFQVQGRNL